MGGEEENEYYHKLDHRNNSESLCRNQKMKVKHNYFIPGLKARRRTWIYERKFTMADLLHGDLDYRSVDEQSSYFLVIESIKMGASIAINGIQVGNATDQFRRYVFPIPSNVWNKYNESAQPNEENLISVVFLPEIDTQGRFMACSGGWDWAPYTQNAEASCLSRRVFTFGIVKPIYIAKVRNEEAAIIYVVPKVYYLGNSSQLGATIEEEEITGNFKLVVDVYLQYHIMSGNADGLPSLQYGEVIFRASFFESDKIVRTVNATKSGENEIKVTLSVVVEREDIELWWPRGSDGHPTLYSLQVAYRNIKSGRMTKWLEKQIGKFF